MKIKGANKESRLKTKKKKEIEPTLKQGYWMIKLNANHSQPSAVKRRIKSIGRSFDLTRHEDRSEIGYNYLEYKR